MPRGQMSKPFLRRRFTALAAVSMTLGLVFAPAATSHGNPHGAPPGQVDKGNGNGNGNGNGSSGYSDAPATAGHVPPGQAKKQAPAPPSAPAVAAPSAAPSNSKAVQSVNNPVTKGNPNAPGQAKKAAAVVAASTQKVPPGQAKKQAKAAAAAAPAPAATAAPAIAASPPAALPAAPAPSTGTPARRTRPKRPAARRSTAQRRSSHRAASRAAARARGAGVSGAGTGSRSAAGATGSRARTTARALAPLTAAGTAAAAAVAGGGSSGAGTRSSHHSNPPSIGGAVHSAGPIQSLIGNLIPVPLPVPDWSKPIILALVLICALLGTRAWLTSRRARRLESQRLRLAADLESLQPALVPEIPASFGPLAVSVAYRPADGPAAGGDFYDVFPVGSSRVAMMVGDVSGHGRNALTRAAHMRYMLRAYLETGLDPRSALKLAGRVLGADDEALFTTVAVAVYDRSASTITYAAAGHPPPITLGPGAHQPLSIASPALGWGEPTGRRQTTVPFGEYARACFFSDGVTEVRVPEGLLGRNQLTHEVEQSESATELLERVQREALLIRDDMAACLVEARAGTPISEIRIEEFEVEMRHLDAGQGERFLNECGVSSENASSTLAHARLIVTDSGSALLRVDMGDGTAAASAGGSAPVSLTHASRPGPVQSLVPRAPLRRLSRRTGWFWRVSPSPPS